MASSESASERLVRNAHQHRRTFYRLLAVVAGLGVTIPFLVPLGWLVVLSFTPPDAVYQMGLFPERLSLVNYVVVLTQFPFPLYVFNSVVVATLTTVMVLVVGSLAGYAFGRLEFPGRRALFVTTLAVAYFPPISFLVPLFHLFTGNVEVLGLSSPNVYNTPAALVLPLGSLTMPLAVFLLTVFYRGIPDRLEDAARLAGATRFGALLRVIVPLSAPGVATAAVVTFLQVYNEFLFSFLMNDGSVDHWATIVPGIINAREVGWTVGAAASVVSIFPVAILVLFANDRIVEGLGTATRRD